MSDQAPAPAVDKMSYEAAMAGLEDVVNRLERGDVPLEESIALYERGEALRARCEALLQEAEMKVAQITAGPDGEVAAAPMKG
ncbi:exodeoxyribonuclease VII small subunit [Rhodovulum sp. DZ06]|uniref:exodeoxyribonuclease VII small subunit n=1 Tax=Rhodovulum sp. DZ06 TaxID=3425126 RepID=UPI003D341759